MPSEKPDFPLSAAAERMFESPAPRAQDNELYTQFKYTRLKGLDYNNGDGTVSRRDPSRPIWVGDRYYLYFQAFNEPSGTKGDWCPISMAYADSPDGPWTRVGKMMVPFGKKGEWDEDQTQDPHPIIYKGKIYLYYKAAYNKWPDIRDKYAVAHGLAIADNPMGPFKKHPLNPVLNSGHETTYFPFKEGIAALAIKDGNEANTIQYAKDGVNFNIAATVELTPTAAGAFTPDAFTGTDYGRGITWGMCHFINAATTRDKQHSIIARFDCDLSLDCNEPSLKSTGVWHRPEVYFKQGLGKLRKKREKTQIENN
ncbi:glycoside hydrolase family protein [Saccharicrinis fermentans]|uniref:Glycosyl hydrolase family 43 n=1 Tax=Saccharicrinis fermentans DSM 9555 = JCM 21142 TaxID=869213 RepID=W7Y9M5_9BACT|nr:hypothetical protein [Saccharicrinis fermentans]GAF05037.1 glycosyl hydrolase family 43 [Saccharicrinis fermentans DSM 9555 = JCM 21142]